MKRYIQLRFTTLVTFIICCSSEMYAQNLVHGYINVSGSKIYVEAGGRGNAVIFVHAGFQDHRMWKQQIAAFTKDHLVLLIDLPGHGQTIDSSSSILAENIIRSVMDSLRISKASLVGVSLGGAVITDFAIAYPERIDKLILVSSGLTGWDEGRKLLPDTKQYEAMLDSALMKKDTAAAAEVFTHYWFDGPQRKPKDFDINLRKEVLNTTYYNMKQHKVSGWPRFASPTAINKLRRITVPVLIITGKEDLDEILQMNAYLVRNIPGARQIFVDNAAHMLSMEKPQQFNDAIRKFIE